ncbi:MAG: oxalate/formate MFS antiporter [Bryobacterales bacterium]|nr:oxalate/formate MFS antiporter [Bryobacterales bacterium]
MNRWLRLAAAMAAMTMTGNLQYAWTLFVHPIIAGTGWKLSEVQWGFTFFIACMTWVMPLSGWLIDRMGPRVFMTVAGVLCAAGWGSLGHARSLPEFYLLYSIAGVGNGFVYCCSIAVALKWFPDKRGLASGLIAGSYGSGAALFIPIFSHLIQVTDYRATFLSTGIVGGMLVIIAGQVLRNPPGGALAAPQTVRKSRGSGEDYNSWRMLHSPRFYMLYMMMLMVGIGGLMATAQVAPVARNYKVGATAMAIALSLNPIGNGLGRVFWGWASDHIGRERTMFVAFSLQSVFLVSVVTVGRWGDVWFVAAMALVFLTWGELYVLFPAVLADIFGSRHAASNYSILYSTKGLSSILAGGLAAALFEKTGSWNYAFYGSAALALCSAVAALGLRRASLPVKAGIQGIAAEGQAPQGYSG